MAGFYTNLADDPKALSLALYPRSKRSGFTAILVKSSLLIRVDTDASSVYTCFNISQRWSYDGSSFG